MPSVRYYDYGVMRRESDQRMLDVQRRTGAQTMPMHRVTPEKGEQMRPAAGSVPIGSQDAAMCKNIDDTGQIPQCGCTMRRQETEGVDCSVSCGEQKNRSLTGEELLIAALLVLAVSEGCELPLILTLLYLLL